MMTDPAHRARPARLLGRSRPWRGLCLAFVATVLAVPTMAGASPIDRLRFLTEEYPPYNMTVDGEKTGLATELLAAVFDAAGTDTTLADVRVLPWARGYQTTLREPNTVLYSTTRTAAREDLFTWVGPIADTTIGIIGASDSPPLPDDLATLSEVRIATIRDDVAEQLLEERGVGTDVIHATATLETIVRLLEAGRVDYWAYEVNVARYVLGQRGIADGYQVKGELTSSQLYYAFNPDSDPAALTAFRKALETVKASGRHAELLATYTE